MFQDWFFQTYLKTEGLRTALCIDFRSLAAGLFSHWGNKEIALNTIT